MSEKFNGFWRKVKEGASFFPIVLLDVLFITVMFLIAAVITGAIITVCWNVAMTTMFGFNKITIVQAFVLAVTIGCLRANYISSAKSKYKELKEKMAKVLLVILIILFELISILITIWLVMYSLNNIIPQLLNVELVQINFAQAFGFAYLFNFFFGDSKSDSEKINPYHPLASEKRLS